LGKKRTICYNIKASWHTISRMYNSHAVDHDSSISVGYVLLNLHRENGIPSTQIAPQLGMEPRSLTRLLKAMEQVLSDQIDEADLQIFQNTLEKIIRITEQNFKTSI